MKRGGIRWIAVLIGSITDDVPENGDTQNHNPDHQYYGQLIGVELFHVCRLLPGAL